MEGISRPAGAGPVLEFLGKSYALRGRTCGFYAAVEAEIVSRRGDPVGILQRAAPSLKAGGLSLSDIRELVDSVVRASIAMRDVRFSDVPWGRAFELWWAMNDGNVSVSRVHDIMLESILVNRDSAWDWIVDAREKVRLASGEQGNLIGRRTTTTEEPATASDGP